jgi:periplasmic divalent cation tolerance protein
VNPDPLAPIIEIEITGPNTEWATTQARVLIDDHLVASATVIPGAVSMYRWHGEIVTSEEVVLRLRTRATLRTRVLDRVIHPHPYDTPGIRVYEVTTTNDYQQWVNIETTNPSADTYRRP